MIDLIVANGNCNAQTGIGYPYLPFREILELLTGDVEARWSAGAITKEYAQILWNLIPVTAQALMEAGPDLVDTFIPAAVLFERTAIDFAHLWREQGRVDEARQVVREIYAWFSEGFDIPNPAFCQDDS